MSRTSKADAPVSFDEPGIEVRYAKLDDYTVAFETHKADMSPVPFSLVGIVIQVSQYTGLFNAAARRIEAVTA